MSITCTDLIALSQRLIAGTDEVDLRSGVSRSYYAAYHHLCAWELKLPVPGSNSGPGAVRISNWLTDLTIQHQNALPSRRNFPRHCQQ